MLADAASLTLPATSLASRCYSLMFYGCTSLVNAPALPATTLAPRCYQNMFYGCTSLVTAPALPATTLAMCCYQLMFNGCRHLKRIATSQPTWNDPSGNLATAEWLLGTSATGDFYCDTSALDTSISDSSHVPAGWTVKDISELTT